MDLQGKIDKSIITAGDFKAYLSETEQIKQTWN